MSCLRTCTGFWEKPAEPPALRLKHSPFTLLPQTEGPQTRSTQTSTDERPDHAAIVTSAPHIRPNHVPNAP